MFFSDFRGGSKDKGWLAPSFTSTLALTRKSVPPSVLKKADGIVDAFDGLFCRSRPAFAQQRVFDTARTLSFASILALGRHTLTGMLVTSGREFEDWSSAYRIIGRGRMDKDARFAPVISELTDHLGQDEPLVAVMDDTHVRKRGKKVAGAYCVPWMETKADLCS